MVAKLALVLLAVAFVVAAAMAMSFWYFNREAEREHERELRRMEQTETVWDAVDDETGIDAELDEGTADGTDRSGSDSG